MKKNKPIEFEIIEGNSTQIKYLYQLLNDRKFNISNINIPSYNEHKEFVINNPYRVWYLVFENENYIGTFYIKNDNSIGINLINETQDNIHQILKYINDEYLPLNEKKSVIPGYFYINVPIANKKLQKILSNFNINKIQVSYKI